MRELNDGPQLTTLERPPGKKGTMSGRGQKVNSASLSGGEGEASRVTIGEEDGVKGGRLRNARSDFRKKCDTQLRRQINKLIQVESGSKKE